MFKSLFRGIGSLLTAGAWQVEEAADKAQSTELLLDHVDEAVEQDAQITLDKVDDALTAYHQLELRAEREKQAVKGWMEKAKRAVDEAKKYDEGTPERGKWEKLAKQALVEKMKAEARLAPIAKALDESKDEYEQALKMVEQVGLSKEEAISQRDRLEITRATAEAKKKLASAARGDGANQVKSLLAEVTSKVDKLMAEAEAEEEIAEQLPMSASQVEAEMSSLSRQDRVNDEFARLMGTSGKTKALK